MLDLRRGGDAGKERQPQVGAGTDDVVVRSRRDGEVSASVVRFLRLVDRQHGAGTDKQPVDLPSVADCLSRSGVAEGDLDAADPASEQRLADGNCGRRILERCDRDDPCGVQVLDDHAFARSFHLWQTLSRGNVIDRKSVV